MENYAYSDDDLPVSAAKSIIQSAVQEYECDDIQIENNPRISVADGGAWVQAWVWVPTKEILL